MEIFCKELNCTSPMDIEFFLNHPKENVVVADITSDENIMETMRAQHIVEEVGEEEDGEEFPAIIYEQAKDGAKMLELYLLRREGNNSTYQIKGARQTRLEEYLKCFKFTC
ncbi:hypothetical protein Golomagni_06039 [Golovinomyces magnicellulatus]|nr:hypothetical protein Golomagni_06039 [Golovinomyces magnicellulatus]